MSIADSMMHGQDYNGQDVRGWIATEKLDGCRAYWDGRTLWSRGGHAVNVPTELLAELPAGIHLDGELYGGIGTRPTVAAGMRTGRWRCPVTFNAFDAPSEVGDIVDRRKTAGNVLIGSRHVFLIPDREISGIGDAIALLRDVKKTGGEGLMLYQRGQAYRPGRFTHILKFKHEDLHNAQYH